MKICMVTSHIPPYQSANAILPQILASELKHDGNEVSFIIPDKAINDRPESMTDYKYDIIRLRKKKRNIPGFVKLDSIISFLDIYKQVKPALKGIDVVHIHSNGILHQVTAHIAKRKRIPIILTHYGTEIWHYKPKRPRLLDLFYRMNMQSSYVTYYSQFLMDHSIKAGIVPKNPIVIYPPAGDEFRVLNENDRKNLRKELGIKASNILVNVKRLHPLGGHEYLIKAMPEVLKKFPDTILFICGSGELMNELEELKNSLGLQDNVRLLGMVDNDVIWKYYAVSDLYVLTSVLEALPTVVVEALACGTPAVMTETPGGKELHKLFPDDISLVEMRNPSQTAAAINSFLSQKRRTIESTLKVVERLFRTDFIYKKYQQIYTESLKSNER